MKFGVREICDVVLKAKANQVIGNKQFYKNEPVIYFDTLKTSNMEGAATTVYAQGGRGNTNLVAWEGERTVTFTMEDALISPEGFMILSGAGLVEASDNNKIKQHVTQTIDKKDVLKFDPALKTALETSYDTNEAKLTALKAITSVDVPLNYKPYFDTTSVDEDYVYVFFMKNGEIISEAYLSHGVAKKIKEIKNEGSTTISKDTIDEPKSVKVAAFERSDQKGYIIDPDDFAKCLSDFDSVMVDYYTERESGAKQIEITADKFGGNYYLEASTLFRNQDGVDMPAEFIIPNCKIQSNFNFTMASSGDPSTFTFTMDAFPDYTRFDHSKKVLAAIQIIEEDETVDNDIRRKTNAYVANKG